jgi:hypothetical protein
VENAAKRRKTYGGTVQWESHSTTSSPPPAQDPRDNLASETRRILSSSQSVIVPVDNDAVSGVTRSQTSRISSGGRIEKPQMSRRVPGVVPKDQEETVTYVLRYQVFKHIKYAITNSQYRANINSSDRATIGTKVGLNGLFRRR